MTKSTPLRVQRALLKAAKKQYVNALAANRIAENVIHYTRYGYYTGQNVVGYKSPKAILDKFKFQLDSTAKVYKHLKQERKQMQHENRQAYKKSAEATGPVLPLNDVDVFLEDLKTVLEPGFDLDLRVIKRCDCETCFYGYQIVEDIPRPKACDE